MKHGLKITLWLLLLLWANALQVVASTHWHSNAGFVASSAATPDVPQPGDFDEGGCVLCKVAAHASTAAPPPSPWSLYAAFEFHGAREHRSSPAAPLSNPSHAWRSRAPPLI
jgi:hypothetical protein